MNAPLTGARSELGRILAPRLAASATENVHINVAGQQANSLLHDGHAWNHFAHSALTGTRRAMCSARADGASMFVHASFAFVHAVERGALHQFDAASALLATARPPNARKIFYAIDGNAIPFMQRWMRSRIGSAGEPHCICRGAPDSSPG